MTPSADAASVCAGGGDMGRLMRSIDWRQTAVGPVESWPQSLRTALSILLETGFPMYIAWGPDFTQFYNDGYRPILGSTKHPSAMGGSTRDTFAEIWPVIGPMFDDVMRGTPTTLVDFMLPLDRHGFAEECYFIFSYSPIREEGGRVGGVLVTVTETTQRVLGERRLKTTQALVAETRDAQTMQQACALATRVLARNPADLPYGRLFLLSADLRTATLAGADDGAAGPATLALTGSPWHDMSHRGDWPGCTLSPEQAASWGWVVPDTVRSLQLLPVRAPGVATPIGVLVAGTSARLIVDDAYRDFLNLVASQIGAALAAARTLEEAQARAAALAALDHAKTAFFSNVSHEFRTPLTLMIAPTEDALATPERCLQGVELEAVHRNQVRLLKLVNTLLDFSRIEAGRETARFEATELAALTAHLASSFRSATERAGLALVVDAAPLPAPVFVDRAMWEKIVLNLLSNAFKYTFDGSITVSLRADGDHVELQVRDTGTGIAAADLPRIFERFYRVQRPAGRSHEGSGIGLALVRELVAIHGGTISAASSVGEGSVFSIRLPMGAAHLPAQMVVAEDDSGAAGGVTDHPASAVARSFVDEALQWLPRPVAAPPAAAPEAPRPLAGERILVADDNADMRDYLTRLLAHRFTVQTVANGLEALAAARQRLPDVVISDVMMPGLDGFELLAALRANEATRGLPFIMLSARAGEEARIEGLQSGADDYLVKPFSARELLARVDAQLVRRRMRALEEAHAVRLASVFANAPVGVAILQGPEHRYEFANQAYLALIDGRPVLGLTVSEALPELAGQGIFELLDKVYRSGEPLVGRSVPVTLRSASGQDVEHFFDFVYQPLKDRHAPVTGIAVVAFDVTELTRARREAEAANRAKDEFLAMLGHELRNPLAPIVIALELLRARNPSGGERERAIIERQVRHLVGLVDDLLDVSRITRGQVQLRCERIDLTDIVAKAVEMTEALISSKRQRLRLDLAPALVVQGDAARLTQVLVNLLTNASKYTDAAGRIELRARAREGRVELCVRDNGRGISADVLPRVFELFTQERQELDRSAGGLGLGLAIVRSLVEAHGGQVRAYSAGKGRGAEFTVTLPCIGAASAAPAAAAPATAPAAPAPVPAALRVMVVDDNHDAAAMLAGYVELLGHDVAIAHDGHQALAMLPEFGPDVVLLDIGLPGLDGFDVARRMRATPGPSGLRLVAVTGYGREVDRRRSQEAGFDHHLVKPVDPDQLSALLQQLAHPVVQ